MKNVELDVNEANIDKLYHDDNKNKDIELEAYRKFLSKKYHPMIVDSLHDRFIKILKSLPNFDVDVFFKIYEHDFTPLKQYKYEKTKRFSIITSLVIIIGAIFTAIDYFSTLYMAKFSIHPTLLFHMFLVLLFSISSIYAASIVIEARNTIQSQNTMIHTNTLVAEEVLKRIKTNQLGRLAVYKKLAGALHSYSVDNFNETFDEYDKHISAKNNKNKK